MKIMNNNSINNLSKVKSKSSIGENGKIIYTIEKHQWKIFIPRVQQTLFFEIENQ
jgi:hypothetical protein